MTELQHVILKQLAMVLGDVKAVTSVEFVGGEIHRDISIEQINRVSGQVIARKSDGETFEFFVPRVQRIIE